MSVVARRDWHRKQTRHRELTGERGRYDFQELEEKHSFTDATGVEERIRTHFVPYDVYAQKLLRLHPEWFEAKVEQDRFERLDSPHVRKRMVNGEECVAMFEGLIVDDARPHSTAATFSKSRSLQDVAQLADSQTAAATWVSEMHSAAHQEGKCVQFHEKPFVQPSDIRNLESTSVCGPAASSADALRIFARDLAKVQALKQEVEAFMLEGIQHHSGSARAKQSAKPLWRLKLDAKRKRLERIDRQEIQLHEFKDELVALKCAAA
jgi:hypothetical protein